MLYACSAITDAPTVPKNSPVNNFDIPSVHMLVISVKTHSFGREQPETLALDPVSFRLAQAPFGQSHMIYEVVIDVSELCLYELRTGQMAGAAVCPAKQRSQITRTVPAHVHRALQSQHRCHAHAMIRNQ